MASPSEHETKEGLRCFGRYLGSGYTAVCRGLVLEKDTEQGLGVRCNKKGRAKKGMFSRDRDTSKCNGFHPLEVLISQAMEQELLDPEQLERIRIAVSEEKTENSGEQKMATETKDEESRNASRVVLEPPVYPNIQPLDALNALGALEAKRQELVEEIVRFHFPTFSSGQMKGYALQVMRCVEREREEVNPQSVRVRVVRVKNGYGVEFSSSRSVVDRFDMGDWSKISIARDVALKIVSFLNLCDIKTQFVELDDTE